MEKMWNSLDLKCPSSDVVEYRPQDSHLIEKLRDFVTVLTTAADTLTSDHPIWKEMSVLRNIQAKYKRILHCDKCLFYLHRVAHCLKKMVLLNLSKSYLDLAERFLIGFQDVSGTFRLPSRQQVEYILIRTQSAAKLVCEAIRYSRETFCFLIKKLKIGHLVLDFIMAASVIARLHVMFKGILVQLCDMYQKVLTWRYKVKQGEFKWLQKLDLPVDLEKWLAASEWELNKSFPMSKEDAEFLENIIKKLNGSTVSDTESVTVIHNADDEDCMIVDEKEDADYGEVIPRTSSEKVDSTLTSLQKICLSRVLLASGFEELEDAWNDICKLKQDPLPLTLTTKKRITISRFLVRKKKNSMRVNRPKKRCRSDVRVAATMLAKYLGFTQDEINLYRSDPHSYLILRESDAKLQPVRKLKELKALYRYLCEMLVSSKDVVKHQKLSKIFRRQIADIRLLQRTEQKKAAKNLILCTSKVILTLIRR